MDTKLPIPGSLKGKLTMDMVSEISEFCDSEGVANPARFLAEVMAGKDPRNRVSRLWEIVTRAENENRRFTDAESEEIRGLVLSNDAYRGELVSLTESIKAAEKLCEYLYAKKKALEVSGHMTATVAVTEPLSVDEIKQLNEIFLTDF